MATVEELVNNLYEMVQDAGAVPFTDKCMLERDRVLDMLDELRVSLPSDIKMAQDIVEKRNELIAAGKREADALKKQAEESARVMVSETEVVKAGARQGQGNPRQCRDPVPRAAQGGKHVLRGHTEAHGGVGCAWPGRSEEGARAFS